MENLVILEKLTYPSGEDAFLCSLESDGNARLVVVDAGELVVNTKEHLRQKDG